MGKCRFGASLFYMCRACCIIYMFGASFLSSKAYVLTPLTSPYAKVQVMINKNRESLGACYPKNM